VKERVENDFHNLDFIPEHRMPMKMPNFIQKILSQIDKEIGLPYQILRPSVIGGKMLSEENNNFISKYMVFFLAKFFHFTAQRRNDRKMYAS
jgi:hypothetical protein